MRYIKLGRSGLDVSPIAVGAMTYGEPGRGHPVWSLAEDDSQPLIKHAIEAGINFFDTANIYSQGSSEEILGRALTDFADRDDIVIATKVRHPMRPGPNGKGLSRKAIMTEIDHSLRRLGTDYIDLYQIHRLDKSTPLEETLEALHDVVKAGKARYIGASSMYAWEFSKALHLQTLRGWTRFVGAVAAARGVTRAQIALAWLRRNPVVVAPLVGASSTAQIDDAVASLDLDLSDEEAAALQAHYTPRDDFQGVSDEAVLARITARIPGLAPAGA